MILLFEQYILTQACEHGISTVGLNSLAVNIGIENNAVLAGEFHITKVILIVHLFGDVPEIQAQYPAMQAVTVAVLKFCGFITPGKIKQLIGCITAEGAQVAQFLLCRVAVIHPLHNALVMAGEHIHGKLINLA